jgi:hypothetical protein
VNEQCLLSKCYSPGRAFCLLPWCSFIIRLHYKLTHSNRELSARSLHSPLKQKHGPLWRATYAHVFSIANLHQAAPTLQHTHAPIEPTAKQFKMSVSNLSGRTPPLQDASTPLNHPNSTPYPSASSVYEGTYRVMLRSPYSSRSGRYGLPQSNDFGPPMRFLVGPSDVAFDVDVNLLSEWSPAFARKPAVHHIDMLYTIYPIFLPDVSVNDFTVLCQWMYTGAKPESDRPEHLFPLCTVSNPSVRSVLRHETLPMRNVSRLDVAEHQLTSFPDF